MKAPFALFLALTLSCGSTAALAGQKICSGTHGPVCALGKDGKRTTIRNACHAANAGARVLHKGACEGGDVCSMIYTPVCAADPQTGNQKTYSSLCVAEHADAALLHDGACGP